MDFACGSYLTTPARERKAFFFPRQQPSQWETHITQPLGSHYTWNPQFTAMGLSFLTAYQPPTSYLSWTYLWFWCSFSVLDCSFLLVLNKPILASKITGSFISLWERVQIFNNWHSMGRQPMRTNLSHSTQWVLEPSCPSIVLGITYSCWSMGRSARVPEQGWVPRAKEGTLGGTLGIGHCQLVPKHSDISTHAPPYLYIPLYINTSCLV